MKVLYEIIFASIALFSYSWALPVIVAMLSFVLNLHFPPTRYFFFCINTTMLFLDWRRPSPILYAELCVETWRWLFLHSTRRFQVLVALLFILFIWCFPSICLSSTEPQSLSSWNKKFILGSCLGSYSLPNLAGLTSAKSLLSRTLIFCL